MQTKARISGGGLTRFVYQGQTIAWLTQVSEVPPRSVSQGGSAQDIHPLDSKHPVEIALPRAVGSGQITLQVQELWHQDVWEMLGAAQSYGAGTNVSLGPFAGAKTLIEVLSRQLSMGAVTMQKVIQTPTGQPRVKNYYNCVITDIDEGETVQVGSMSVAKNITIRYTHAAWA